MNKTEFTRLRTAWYRKLRESGFRDVERADGSIADSHRLTWALGMGPLILQARSEYFSAAASYLAEATFPTQTERRIWAMHADGVTIREIASKVGHLKDFVWRRVVKHRNLMRLNRPVCRGSEAET